MTESAEKNFPAYSHLPKAVALLKESSLSMGEISDQLGYANLSAFNRAFKRWFDTNPSTLRA